MDNTMLSKSSLTFYPLFDSGVLPKMAAVYQYGPVDTGIRGSAGTGIPVWRLSQYHDAHPYHDRARQGSRGACQSLCKLLTLAVISATRIKTIKWLTGSASGNLTIWLILVYMCVY
jgi:hypothetical protein